MKLTAQELEEQAVAEKYDALFLKAQGNAELEKQLISQQEGELNVIRKKFTDEELERIEKNTKDAIALKHSLTRASLDEDLVIMNEKFESERIALRENELLSADEKILLNNEILEREKSEEQAMRDKWAKIEIEKEKAKEDELRKERDKIFKAIEKGLTAVADLNTLVTNIQLSQAKGNEKEQEKIAKKSFERNKAIQISMATMSTLQGVINALSTQTLIPDPLGSILKGANAVAVGLSGAANISKIASTTFSGGGSPSPSVPPEQSIGGASASSFSIGDLTGSTSSLEDTITSETSGTNQVVVVETDITDVVNNVAVIKELSTF